VLPLIAVVLAASRSQLTGDPVDALAAATGLAIAVLALVAAVAHEAGHVVVARLRRIPYGPSTLYFFGGVETVDRPAASPRDEVLVASGGPVASLALAVALGAAAAAIPAGTGAIEAVREALILGSGLSVLIGVANLLPGDPLDGGRIVHGVAWGATGDPRRARRIAGRTGRSMGLLLIGGGFVVALAGDATDSIVLIAAGWFVRSGAIAAERREGIRDLVGELRVEDAMDRDAPALAPQLTLDTFAPAALESGDRDAFAVRRDGELVGVLGLRAIRRLRRDRWPTTRVEDAMTVLADLTALAPEAPLWPAIEELQRSGGDALPVVGETGVVGLLTRVSVARLVTERARATGRAL
jgi:Zn-dependent protease